MEPVRLERKGRSGVEPQKSEKLKRREAEKLKTTGGKTERGEPRNTRKRGGKTGDGFATKRRKESQKEILSFSFCGSLCLLVVFRCFQWNGYFPARRAKENSPAIHCWVKRPACSEVPRGTKEKTCVHGGFLSSLPGLNGMDVHNPSDESLGYCLTSLWDYVSRPSFSSSENTEAPRLWPRRADRAPAT